MDRISDAGQQAGGTVRQGPWQEGLGGDVDQFDTAREDTPVSEIAALLERHVPIVSDNKVVGIVSRSCGII